MHKLATMLRRFALFGLWLLLAVLTIALGWTLLQLADLAGQPDARNIALTRQPAYRATATAMRALDTGSSNASGRLLLLNDAPTPPPIDSNAAIDLPTLLLPPTPSHAEIAGAQVPPSAQKIIRDHSLVNIILLGGDSELTPDDFVRTDTMIVVSLNLDTGDAAMLSLPRDLFVYMPHGNMGRLNTAYGIGELRGWQPGGGFGLLRQTLFYNFGINAHYHAIVNFSAFETIIDRLGGVDIAVDCAYQDYYPADRQNEGVNEYILRTLPVGYHSFDGFDALWYARTRRNTSDFDRGRRQQILLRAMWRKARQIGLLSTTPALWAELTDIVTTDLPLDAALRLLPHVIGLQLDEIEHFTFLPDLHTRGWTTPDGADVLIPQPDVVHRLMQDFYTPPSPHQAAVSSPTIAVYNGSGKADWDIVASERLRWAGLNAVAMGALANGETRESSQLTDLVAAQKGSLVPLLLRALNMDAEQVTVKADAGREFDYRVVLGRDYESCTFGVLPIDE